MSTAVATRQDTAAQPPSTLAAVRKMQDQFALALPDHVSPEKFVRVVVTAIQSNPDLQRADRDSILGAALKCAQDGLIPDGREAALVVYSGKAQYMPMIAGILAKVRRSGEMSTIGAHVVYENDAFTYVLGDEERIEHSPALTNRGKPIAAYAIAKTKDGGLYREVMSVDQINQVRNVSKAKNAGPWSQWWDEMARKTVLRRLSKRLPMSTDLQQIFDRDNDHYDLRAQSQGEATLRRLHADFDDPAPPAIDDTANTVTDATFEDAPASDAADDDFPGDKPAQQAEQPRQEAQKPAEGVSTASQALTTVAARLQAFRAQVSKAPNTREMQALWSRSAQLRNDIDAGDPDEVGTSAELESWFQETYAAKEAEEKAERAKGGA
ncbi:recombination protein RecT [Caulobacter sp. BE264]|uniref:recombinase RecT n=1 Tax=Caulobacter sp. BE264 TaxID=2817724 RepID=UPI00286210B2|nr:recombinase RecT [Caulobacter sp. BE264]MDR7232785.1 recombination protein RecT [Caulobacter sp. BE264]